VVDAESLLSAVEPAAGPQPGPEGPPAATSSFANVGDIRTDGDGLRPGMLGGESGAQGLAGSSGEDGLTGAPAGSFTTYGPGSGGFAWSLTEDARFMARDAGGSTRDDGGAGSSRPDDGSGVPGDGSDG